MHLALAVLCPGHGSQLTLCDGSSCSSWRHGQDVVLDFGRQVQQAEDPRHLCRMQSGPFGQGIPGQTGGLVQPLLELIGLFEDGLNSGWGG